MKCNKGLTLIRIVRKARYQRRKVCVKMEIRYGCIKSYINLDKNSEESQILEKKGLHEDGNKECCINHIYINLDKNSEESQEQEKKGLHEDGNQEWCMNHIHINLDKNSEECQEPEKKGLHKDGNQEWSVKSIQPNSDFNGAFLTIRIVSPTVIKSLIYF